MESTKTVEQKNAAWYAACFEHKQRGSGDRFTCLADHAPVALSQLVYDIHADYFGGCLPNDWIYATIAEAFDALAEDALDDISIEADPYYNQLYAWLGNSYAAEYCNEAISSFSYCKLADDYDLYAHIGIAQYMAKDRIYHAVNDFINEAV